MTEPHLPSPSEPATGTVGVRVELPAHLQHLARIRGEITLDLDDHPTQSSVLDALETRFPQPRGTLRDQHTGQRRPFIRIFACGKDLSHNPPDHPLPEPIAAGAEPLLIIGAVAGG